MREALFRKRSEMPAQATRAEMPTFADVSPEYQRLVAKREELEGQRTELEKERREIIGRLETQKGGPQHNVRVAALLGDEIEGVSTADDRHRLQSITSMLRDIEQAILAIGGRLTVEQGMASRLICEQVKDAYADKVRAVCLAMVELNQRHRELTEFTDELDRADVSWTGSLFPMSPLMLGSVNDSQGRIAQYLREAVQHGFISVEAIPERFRRG